MRPSKNKTENEKGEKTLSIWMGAMGHKEAKLSVSV